MSEKKISLILVGLIWLAVGIYLGITGTNWMLGLGLGKKLIIFLAISTIIGLLKGKFALKKVASRYYKRADTIQFNKSDILTGWVRILGPKGFILIGLMMAMGIFLRHSNIDRPILGIVYLAVGIALVYASKIFFENKIQVG